MVKKIIGLLAFAALCFSQTGGVTVPVYTAYKETTLAAGAEVLTIRKPANTNRSAFLLDADIYCDVACVVTIEVGGSYSTGTTVTPAPGRSTWGVSAILATSGTTITGTTTVMKYKIPAGGNKSLDLRGMFLTETNDEFTIRTDAITGLVILAVRWESRA